MFDPIQVCAAAVLLYKVVYLGWWSLLWKLVGRYWASLGWVSLLHLWNGSYTWSSGFETLWERLIPACVYLSSYSWTQNHRLLFVSTTFWPYRRRRDCLDWYYWRSINLLDSYQGLLSCSVINLQCWYALVSGVWRVTQESKTLPLFGGLGCCYLCALPTFSQPWNVGRWSSRSKLRLHSC